jgi:hypothetical protein
MDTFLLTSNSPLVSAMVAGMASEKLTVSPFTALARASRNVPGPLSAVLVTVSVRAVAVVVSAKAQSMANKLLKFSLMGQN